MTQSNVECTPGYSTKWGPCAQCSAGMTSDGGGTDCYCDAGTTITIINTCTACNRGQYSEQKSKSCTNCASNEVSGPLQRKCMPSSECDDSKGFELNLQWKSCACPQNMYLSLDKSICISSCPTNQTYNYLSDNRQQQRYCTCQKGFIATPDGTNCIALNDCNESNNMKLNGYVCSCKDESMLSKFDPVTNTTVCESIAQCQKSEFYDKMSNSCKPCQPNAESQGGQDEKCTCVQGYVEIGGACSLDVPSCSANQYLQNNKCIECPANSTSPGGASVSCMCTDTNLTWEDGKCTQKTLNCPENHFILNNSCSRCPVNSTSIGGNSTSCSCTGVDMKWVNGVCEVGVQGSEKEVNKSQGNVVAIVVPIILVLLAAVLVAVLVPLLRKKRHNKIAQKTRADIV